MIAAAARTVGNLLPEIRQEHSSATPPGESVPPHRPQLLHGDVPEAPAPLEFRLPGVHAHRNLTFLPQVLSPGSTPLPARTPMHTGIVQLMGLG